MPNKDNLNNLCNRDSNGWCEYCQCFATPMADKDDFHCVALENELQSTQYQEEDDFGRDLDCGKD